MEKISIGYKIVRNINGRLLSYNGGVLKCSPINLEYKQGEYCIPKLQGTLLFYFDTKENAKEYLYYSDDNYIEIWECEVLNGRPFQPFDGVSLYNLLKFYENTNKDNSMNILGSMGAEAIKLLKRI